MLLVLAGTLAQIDKDIGTVIAQYFRCFIARIDLFIFFPRSWNIPTAWWVPFPGGVFIGTLLALNLLVVHAANFRISAQGRRQRIGGITLLLIALAALAASVLDRGSASKISAETNHFGSMLHQLGWGTPAVGLMCMACLVLYRRRAGLVLLLGGFLFLLIGAIASSRLSEEFTLTLEKGETIDFLDSSRHYELAVVDSSLAEETIRDRQLKRETLVALKKMPFDIKVHRYMPNSSRPMPLGQIDPSIIPEYPDYHGIGSEFFVVECAREPGADPAPAVDVELIDRAGGKSLGRYLFSLWFYPNFTQRQLNFHSLVEVGGKQYRICLRPRREGLRDAKGNPFSITLLDFVHENYEGTQMPKQYSDRIQLVNEGAGLDRELQIRMNNPLRYARFTFYQFDTLPGGKGPVLLVVRNGARRIPYLSCMLMLAGLLIQFAGEMRGYFRRNA
ncbi:MAG: cytochrome c biogenesis protein ResB [Pontiellaceae bacterium]|nr:cytochrome c biogenesis protein ResB [Pontiellaceae bacterium]